MLPNLGHILKYILINCGYLTFTILPSPVTCEQVSLDLALLLTFKTVLHHQAAYLQHWFSSFNFT